MKALAAVITALCLAACSAPERPTIWVERKIYHTLPSMVELRSKTYRIDFADQGQARSLELRKHADFLSSRLKGLGFKETAAGQEAELVFTLYFEILSQDMLRISGGNTTVTSGGTSNHQATVINGGGVSLVSGTSTTPTSTYQSKAPTLRTDTEYSRMVSIVVHRRGLNGKTSEVPVFEAAAFSEGGTRNTPKIFPALIGSLIHGFPGKSGELDAVQMFMDDASLNEEARVGETQFLR